MTSVSILAADRTRPRRLGRVRASVILSHGLLRRGRGTAAVRGGALRSSCRSARSGAVQGPSPRCIATVNLPLAVRAHAGPLDMVALCVRCSMAT